MKTLTVILALTFATAAHAQTTTCQNVNGIYHCITSPVNGGTRQQTCWTVNGKLICR